MKQGRTLVELAQELDRQKATKRDFVANTGAQLRLTTKDDSGFRPDKERGEDIQLKVDGMGNFGMTRIAHQQIAEDFKIPQAFYDRLKDNHPDMLRYTVNSLFSREPLTRMVRTLDGNARAFLSERYRPLDNYDLAEAVLPVFRGEDGYRVESCEITDRRLYIKIISDKVQARVVGDVIQSGIVISNSEIGCGSLKVEPLLYTLRCMNGLIANEYGMRRYHVGKKGNMDIVDGASEYFADETRKADDHAFWLKVRDVVKGSFDQVRFDRLVHKMNQSAEREITGDLPKVVELVAKRYQLNEIERGGVLKHLAKGGDLTQYGLLNAVTRQAQDVPDYERATELERIGGEVLELSETEFERMMRESEAVGAKA